MEAGQAESHQGSGIRLGTQTISGSGKGASAARNHPFPMLGDIGTDGNGREFRLSQLSHFTHIPHATQIVP